MTSIFDHTYQINLSDKNLWIFRMGRKSIGFRSYGLGQSVIFGWKFIFFIFSPLCMLNFEVTLNSIIDYIQLWCMFCARSCHGWRDISRQLALRSGRVWPVHLKNWLYVPNERFFAQRQFFEKLTLKLLEPCSFAQMTVVSSLAKRRRLRSASVGTTRSYSHTICNILEACLYTYLMTPMVQLETDSYMLWCEIIGGS